MVLKQLGYEQTKPTKINIDNISTLKIMNKNTLPTERTCHMDTRYFTIQDWHEDQDIFMKHIPGIIYPSDDLMKSLGYVCMHVTVDL